MDKHLLIYKCQALFENSFLPSALAKAKGKPNREWMPDDIRIKVLKPGTGRGAALYGENIHGADCICDCDGSPSDDCHAHCTVAHGEKPVRTVIWCQQEEETGWSGKPVKEGRGTRAKDEQWHQERFNGVCCPVVKVCE